MRAVWSPEQGHAVPHGGPHVQPGLADLEHVSVVACGWHCGGMDLEHEDSEI